MFFDDVQEIHSARTSSCATTWVTVYTLLIGEKWGGTKRAFSAAAAAEFGRAMHSMWRAWPSERSGVPKVSLEGLLGVGPPEFYGCFGCWKGLMEGKYEIGWIEGLGATGMDIERCFHLWWDRIEIPCPKNQRYQLRTKPAQFDPISFQIFETDDISWRNWKKFAETVSDQSKTSDLRHSDIAIWSSQPVFTIWVCETMRLSGTGKRCEAICWIHHIKQHQFTFRLLKFPLSQANSLTKILRNCELAMAVHRRLESELLHCQLLVLCQSSHVPFLTFHVTNSRADLLPLQSSSLPTWKTITSECSSFLKFSNRQTPQPSVRIWVTVGWYRDKWSQNHLAQQMWLAAAGLSWTPALSPRVLC